MHSYPPAEMEIKKSEKIKEVKRKPTVAHSMNDCTLGQLDPQA